MSHAEHAQAPGQGYGPAGRRRVTNPTSDQVRFIPRALLMGIGGLVVLTTALVAFATLPGQEPAASYPKDLDVVQERALVMLPTDGGGLRVEDAAPGAVIVDLPPESAGFPGGLNRALARVRMLADVPADAPVRLVKWADGRLTLIDPATGWRAELLGFGRDNTEAFARLL